MRFYSLASCGENVGDDGAVPHGVPYKSRTIRNFGLRLLFLNSGNLHKIQYTRTSHRHHFDRTMRSCKFAPAEARVPYDSANEEGFLALPTTFGYVERLFMAGGSLDVCRNV